MTDLASWLLSQIAADEAAARAADPEHDVFDGTGVVVMPNASVGDRTITLPSNVAAHIARHDPARVLAECAAKRAIVEHCQGMLRESEEYDDQPQATDATYTLRLLAQPYADRPGYDPAWKVET